MSAERRPESRDRVLALLNEWERGERFIDHLLEAEDLGASERALVRELAYGVVRQRRWLDHVLRSLCRHDPRGLPMALRNILRIGAYQLLFLDRVPQAVVVDAAVRQVHSRKGGKARAGFVNAVLRSIARGKVPEPPRGSAEALAIAHSHPDWLVHRWQKAFGVETTARLLAWHNQTPPVVFAPNPLRLAPDEDLSEELAAAGILTRPSRLLAGSLIAANATGLTELRAFHEGKFFVQDESAGLLMRAAPRGPGPAFDACAAPGGKTMGLAIAGRDEAPVWAMDRSATRIRRVQENAERLRLRSIRTLVGDGRRPPLAAPVAHLLLDLPCSGTGVVRRRPDLRWRLKPTDLEGLIGLQRKMIETLASYVAPGGTLVYSTCSIEWEENGGVVREFLSRHREYRALGPEDQRLSELHRRQGGRKKDPGTLLLPAIHGADGGYVAVLRRRGGS